MSVRGTGRIRLRRKSTRGWIKKQRAASGQRGKGERAQEDWLQIRKRKSRTQVWGRKVKRDPGSSSPTLGDLATKAGWKSANSRRSLPVAQVHSHPSGPGAAPQRSHLQIGECPTPPRPAEGAEGSEGTAAQRPEPQVRAALPAGRHDTLRARPERRLIGQSACGRSLVSFRLSGACIPQGPALEAYYVDPRGSNHPNEFFVQLFFCYVLTSEK